MARPGDDHGRLTDYLDGLAGEQLAHPTDDLLARLAQPVAEGEPTRLDAVRIDDFLLIAGRETTANMFKHDGSVHGVYEPPVTW
ncbi:hypothetical protein ACFVT2_08425 [Streptomyces sp. NPDC058000]|uniref:hypothetical protein n=1 Tax=Streptomyces sp. NPDC058000 TaxID=3346299 RepID=UPI0036F011FD